MPRQRRLECWRESIPPWSHRIDEQTADTHFKKNPEISLMKMDPIIAVNDVEASSAWYQGLLGCRSKHGGSEFDILVDATGAVLLCLHAWDPHEHPTMADPTVTPGNGLILYLRTPKMRVIYEKARRLGYALAEDKHLNPNALRQEFSLRDPDGYYLTISDDHEYEG